MSYWAWIPALVLMLIVSGWMSVKNNQNPSGNWTLWLWIFNAATSMIPFWPIISKNSKNLLFDSLLYDIIMVLVYTVTIVVMSGWGNSAKLVNIIGAILIIVGFILMRL
jgi:hypothetical protein